MSSWRPILYSICSLKSMAKCHIFGNPVAVSMYRGAFSAIARLPSSPVAAASARPCAAPHFHFRQSGNRRPTHCLQGIGDFHARKTGESPAGSILARRLQETSSVIYSIIRACQRSVRRSPSPKPWATKCYFSI